MSERLIEGWIARDTEIEGQATVARVAEEGLGIGGDRVGLDEAARDVNAEVHRVVLGKGDGHLEARPRRRRCTHVRDRIKGGEVNEAQGGLVGAAGAIAASMSGRLADRLGAYRIVAAGTALILLAWIVMAIGGSSLVVLAGGAALLDLGVQGAHVANQTRVLSHMPEARSRINTIYIVSFFAGGALGSLAGSFIWTLAGWRGVCLLGGTLMGLALLAGYILSNRREAGLLQEN